MKLYCSCHSFMTLLTENILNAVCWINLYIGKFDLMAK